MKKILLMLTVIGTFSFAANSQNQRTAAPTPAPTPKPTAPVEQNQSEDKGGGKHETPEQRAQQSVDRLDKVVMLTAEQKTQVYNLALTRAKNVDAIREKYKGQPEQKEQAKSEMQAAHKEYRQAAKKLLTPDQMNKLKEYHKANKEKEEGERGNNDLPSEKDK